jgi:hypothetical protein
MSLSNYPENKKKLKLENGMLARYKWKNTSWRYVLIIRGLPFSKVLVLLNGKERSVKIDVIEKMIQLDFWETI